VFSVKNSSMTSKSVYPTKNRPGHEKDLRQAAAGTASNFLDIDSYYQAYQLVKDSCFSDNNSAQVPPNTFEGQRGWRRRKHVCLTLSTSQLISNVSENSCHSTPRGSLPPLSPCFHRHFLLSPKLHSIRSSTTD
jgi:hypothetical protein